MLSVIDTIRALSELIETHYPNYPVCDMDITENYPRPSYFIDVDSVETSWVANDYMKESSTIKIVFFAENRYEGFLDLLDMKNGLTMLFDDPLFVHNDTTEYYVSLQNTSSDLYKTDKVLEFTLHADLIQKVERKETEPYMEELEVNMTR
nr:MAG TPA: tail completion protein [Caudoviricetes sp.]